MGVRQGWPLHTNARSGSRQYRPHDFGRNFTVSSKQYWTTSSKSWIAYRFFLSTHTNPRVCSNTTSNSVQCSRIDFTAKKYFRVSALNTPVDFSCCVGRLYFTVVALREINTVQIIPARREQYADFGLARHNSPCRFPAISLQIPPRGNRCSSRWKNNPAQLIPCVRYAIALTVHEFPPVKWLPAWRIDSKVGGTLRPKSIAVQSIENSRNHRWSAHYASQHQKTLGSVSQRKAMRAKSRIPMRHKDFAAVIKHPHPQTPPASPTPPQKRTFPSPLPKIAVPSVQWVSGGIH